MREPEIRTLPFDRSALRLLDSAEQPAMIVGYAALFNAWSPDMGGFIERVLPGAFADTIRDEDIRALVNHDASLILGRNKAGTLRLAEDATGLKVEIDPPETDLAAHYLSALKRGDLSGMSFRFYVEKEAWNYDASPPQRDLIEVDIDDVSIVTYPAYPDTSVAIRSMEAGRKLIPRPGRPRFDRARRLLRLAEAM